MTTPDIPTALVHDGMYRVAFCDTIANISAPTVAELDAGIQLACQITPDGLNREASDERVDDSRLCSTFSTQKMGRTSFENFAQTYVRVDERTGSVDDAYNTLVKGKTGFVVIRDTLPYGDAWAAGQEVEVYPVEAGTRNKATPAANENQTFTVPYAVTSDPDLYATVAA